MGVSPNVIDALKSIVDVNREGWNYTEQERDYARALLGLKPENTPEPSTFRDVLASEATVLQWVSVFREEDGWEIRYETPVIRQVSRICGAGIVQVFTANINLTCGHHQISRSFPDATLGELLDIANELAATRFCGWWKQ